MEYNSLYCQKSGHLAWMQLGGLSTQTTNPNRHFNNHVSSRTPKKAISIKMTTGSTNSVPVLSRRAVLIALAGIISAQSQFKVKAGEQAVEDFRKVTGLQDLAFEFTNQQKFAQAEILWTQIIEMNDKNAAAYSNRGNCRTSQGLFQQAISDFDKASTLAPDEPDPYLGKGVALEGIRRYKEAIDAYTTSNRLSVAKFKAPDPIALNNIGNAYGGLGNWNSAYEYYKKASDMDSRFVFALANESLALYQIGREKEAGTKIRFLIRKYPAFGDMHAANAMILWESGKQLDAETEWYKAVQSDARYQDSDWVKDVRRWPPRLMSALEDFKNIQK